MLHVSIFGSDSLRLDVDLHPEITDVGQRRVSVEEIELIRTLDNCYNELQKLLRRIRQRPELELEEILKVL